MTEQDRRAQLWAKLLAEEQKAPRSASRMSVLGALCVSELTVTGAGATVLSQQQHGDGDGQSPRRGLVHATNAVSTGLEDLQLTVGEGPCLDAFASGGPVLIADLARETARWPGFTPGALKLGAAAVFSFPLQVGVVRLGSLDVYRETPSPLSSGEVADALILADLATATIMVELDGHATEDSSWLADEHAEIHQASGMVQVQLGITTQAALLRLRAHAYTHQQELSDVARQVVTRRLRLTPDDEPA
ncbi:GAF and ANTAR domain-containing protein [Saccharopolyspora gloriosae]|uniref:GAF and ANTAR domain-containing protein n=1 Tax=Saccharopolyspora gloriosae TaxID=455344 RepID=UPI001FB5EB17|nr:GAF and ANTAR domain-containing protein [Saccharopolyspora gloriosae]